MLGGDRLIASAPHAGGVLGLLRPDARPAIAPSSGLRLALGPAVPLDRMPESYAAALRIEHAAAAVGETDIVDLERLSWRTAVAAAPETTQLLRARWLTPLEEKGSCAEQLLEAVRAYLAHGLSIPRTAESIPAHAITLRYRLRRFTAITGADLKSADDIVELAWVLAASRGSSSS